MLCRCMLPLSNAEIFRCYVRFREWKAFARDSGGSRVLRHLSEVFGPMLWLVSRHSHKLRGEGLGAKQGILPMKEPSAKQMSSGNKTLCNIAGNISSLLNKNNYINLILVKIVYIWALQSQGPHKYVNSITSFLVTSSIELWTAPTKKTAPGSYWKSPTKLGGCVTEGLI